MSNADRVLRRKGFVVPPRLIPRPVAHAAPSPSPAWIFALVLLLAACGKSPDQLTAQAVSLLAKGQSDEAKLMFEKALQSNAAHPEAHYQLGLLAQAADRPREALDHFRAAAASGQLKHLVALGRAQLQAYLENPTSTALAQQASDTASRLARNPEAKAEASRLEGYLAVADRRPEDAVRHFSASLAAAPFEDVRLALVQQLLALNREGEAESILKQVPANSPAGAVLADTYYLHVWTQRGCSAAGAALAAYENLLAADPWNARLRQAAHQRRCQGPAAETAYLETFQASVEPAGALRLGDYFAEQANWAPALAWYERAAQQPGIELRRSSALIGLGRFAEAASALNAFLAKHPGDANALGQRGLLLLNGELAGANPVQGIADIRSALAQPKAAILPTLRFHLAASLLRLGLIPEARREIQILEQSGPGALGVQLLKAELELRSGRPEAAESLCRAILLQAPKLREARLVRSLSLAALNRASEARQELRQLAADYPEDQTIALQYLALVAEDPSEKASFSRLLDAAQARPNLNFANRYLLAEILIRSNLSAKGIAILEDLSREASDPRATLRLIELRLRDGQFGPGCEQLAKINAEETRLPTTQRATWWGLRAICLEKEGKSADSLAAHRQALTLRPGDPVFSNNLASALADQGAHLDEALKLAEAAVAAQPNEVQYRDTLGWVLFRKSDQNRAASIYQQLRKNSPLPPNVEAHARQVLGR
jgi:predicted Zn-dependent protease